MAANRHFDTVAFDIREETSMLFFAKTNGAGEIEDYLLVMRAADEDAVYLEINDQLLAGHDLINEARLASNMLTLALHEPADVLDGASELVLTFDDSEDNKTSLEAGALRVFGNLLAGGNA